MIKPLGSLLDFDITLASHKSKMIYLLSKYLLKAPFHPELQRIQHLQLYPVNDCTLT